MEYSEKLKDPRWQKLRLQVFERDFFCCQHCYDSETTLHCHHLYYESGKEPWEYPLTAFKTLCQECHASETKERPDAERALLKAIKQKGFSTGEVELLTEGFCDFKRVTPEAAYSIKLALSNEFIQHILEGLCFLNEDQLSKALSHISEITQEYFETQMKELARDRASRSQASTPQVTG